MSETPTLTNLLGTDQPDVQVERVQQLLQAALMPPITVVLHLPAGMASDIQIITPTALPAELLQEVLLGALKNAQIAEREELKKAAQAAQTPPSGA